MKGNEQLKQMLPGLTDEMPECFKRIAELLDYGAFELCEQHGKDGVMQYVIPYILMMRWSAIWMRSMHLCRENMWRMHR